MQQKFRLVVNYTLGPVLLCLLLGSLYHQVMQQPNLLLRWQHISRVWQQPAFWLVVLLAGVNWGIESRKWQVLVQTLQPFRFFRAYLSVLSGCSVTMLTPNRIGEYGGRILWLPAALRLPAVSLTIIGAISQLWITLLLGTTGLVFLGFFSQQVVPGFPVLPHFWGTMLVYCSAAITLVVGLFYWRVAWLIRLLEKIPVVRNRLKPVQVLDQLSDGRLLRLLSLSLARYSVFVAQYVLLLQLMGVQGSVWVMVWLIAVFYLVMAMAPTIGFIELPLRVTALTTLFQGLTDNELGVASAALAIWVINLVLPAVVGGLVTLRVKVMQQT